MGDNLSLLLKVSKIMHRTLDLDRRIYIILTCATAGCAFGFSRAFLLLVNEDTGMLEGKMGVGPVSQEDANRIWSQMSEEKKSLEELLAEYDRMPAQDSNSLFFLAKKLNISLDKESDVLIKCLRQRQPQIVTGSSDNIKVSRDFLNILGAEKFACVPLLIEDETVGVLLADNLYSNRPLSRESIQSLGFFADQMAVAIWEARLHQQLLENQSKLREMEREMHRSEVLISLGEMAAHLAHEVRNPLVIIGGLARSIGKNTEKVNNPDLLGSIRDRAGAIIKEVERLENLLAETLSFVHLNKPAFQLKDLNEVVEEICNLTEEELKNRNITMLRSLSPLPYLRIDQDQIKQLLFNLIQNAVESMPEGGELGIKTQREEAFAKVEVADTGRGIHPDIREEIFSPFFTTKTKGSGLGLSIVRRIVEQHGGRVKVGKKEDKGASVVIYLPIPEK